MQKHYSSRALMPLRAQRGGSGALLRQELIDTLGLELAPAAQSMPKRQCPWLCNGFSEKSPSQQRPRAGPCAGSSAPPSATVSISGCGALVSPTVWCRQQQFMHNAHEANEVLVFLGQLTLAGFLLRWIAALVISCASAANVVAFSASSSRRQLSHAATQCIKARA
ncbi:hypothetical protein BKA66DRAFT_444501 [Pyrenochaeta sp. MPI-SDFR-AT-0127]|nr:hypothetical protein BKA66DRAFT_444501 [Pyrenochaeta sp. MPI-SDFR-AT-0127]